jgi:hypothetical protein
MGRLTDEYQKRAGREMVRLFNSAIEELENNGYVGHFSDVIIPALTSVLCEQIAEILKTDPLLAREYVMSVIKCVNDARDVEAENEAGARAAGFPNFISMVHEQIDGT